MADDDLVRRLLATAGTTYAEQAGIHLRDKPMPLFELLTMCMLASKPIDAGIATQAARELFRCGLRTPQAVLGADRQTMIRAFGRAHYARYDESSATRMSAIAKAVRDEYGGDVRRLAAHSGHDTYAAKRLLMRFKGIGNTGADIYLREVQDIWPWVRPYFDDRARSAAADLGLPDTPAGLGRLAPRDTARLAAALVRVSLDAHLRAELTDGTMPTG
jgi:endonuclease III